MKIRATGDAIKKAILLAQADLRAARLDWKAANGDLEEEIYNRCCDLEGVIVDLQEMQSVNNTLVTKDGISLGVNVRLIGVHRRMCSTLREMKGRGTEFSRLCDERIDAHTEDMAETARELKLLNSVESTIEVSYLESPELVLGYLEKGSYD